MKIIGVEFRVGFDHMGNLPEVALFPCELQIPAINPVCKNGWSMSVSNICCDFTIHTDAGDRQVQRTQIGYASLEPDGILVERPEDINRLMQLAVRAAKVR